jgi:hypothetical membrane protein
VASLKRIVEKTWIAAFVVIALLFVLSYFKDDTDKLVRILEADIRLILAALITQIAYFCVTVLTWRRALRYSTGKTILLVTGFWLAFLSGAMLYDSTIYVLGLLLTTLVVLFFSHASRLIGKIATATQKTGWLGKLLDTRVTIGEVLTLSAGCVAIWLFLASTFMLFCSSIINFDLTPTNVAVFVLSLTAGYLAGFLAIFAPGGVGVREGVGAAFLSSIVTLNLPRRLLPRPGIHTHAKPPRSPESHPSLRSVRRNEQAPGMAALFRNDLEDPESTPATQSGRLRSRLQRPRDFLVHSTHRDRQAPGIR